MDNELQVFSNEEFGEVRTVVVDNEPWFVGKDVAEALGYGASGSKSATNAIARHICAEDKGVTEMVTPGGKQKVTIINESGLYSLILSSKLESAKRFKHWVTSEVLPAIRKRGMFVQDNLLENHELLFKMLHDYEEQYNRRKQLEEKTAEQGQLIAVQEQQLAELKPKADYHDVILNCPDVVTTSMIAKDYGWSAQKLNDYLNKRGVQYKHREVWLLYQKYAGKGYTHTKTHTYLDYNGQEHCAMQTYWTQKGRLFIYGLMMEDGNLPLMEAKGA